MDGWRGLQYLRRFFKKSVGIMKVPYETCPEGVVSSWLTVDTINLGLAVIPQNGFFHQDQ